jgi:DNA-binding NarL/FixJ family response regulator
VTVRLSSVPRIYCLSPTKVPLAVCVGRCVSGHEQRVASAEAESAAAESRVVAIVLSGESGETVAGLEALEFDFRFADSAEELEGESPAVVVAFAEGTLTAAVATQLPRLREVLTETPVVFVCAGMRPGELRSALAAGVVGIVLREQLDASFLPCLEAVRSGQVCVPRALARQVEPARLSPREKQILGLVVMGYMNCQIAEQLFVAESTVKSHLSSAFTKLGVRSRGEAVELILDPERGLGTGILALGGEPLEAVPAR